VIAHVLVQRDLQCAVTPAPPPLPVTRLVDDDAVHPGAKTRVAAERVDRAEDPQEHFLREIERIVAVADVYDALTSARPYKKEWKAADALEYIRGQRGKHFDPRLADAFLGISDKVQDVQRDLTDPAGDKDYA